MRQIHYSTSTNKSTFRLITFLTAILATTPVSAASPVTAGMPGQQALIIRHVTVLDLENDQHQDNCTVIIRDGKIESLHDEQEPLPEQGMQIDATGHYLLPGLAEMHAHIPPRSSGTAYRDRVLFLYLAAGVTTVRGMLGEPGHLQLRSEAKSYDLLAPRIFTSGPSFNGRSVDGATVAKGMARQQQAAGYDFLKLHPGLSRSEYDAVVETARALQIPFAGHVSVDVGLTRTLQAGQDTIDHLDGYIQAMVIPQHKYDPYDVGFFGARLASVVDEKRIVELARATARAGVWNVPTQSLIENFVLPTDGKTLASRPEMAYMPDSIVRSWQKTKTRILEDDDYDKKMAARFVDLRRKLILALHEAGAPLLLGSDAPQVFNVPGFAIHRELATLVQAGLSPRDALLTGTRNPAQFFSAENTFGSIRAGLEADLILLSADPTKDIANISTIAGVIARGRWLSAAYIDERLSELAQQ